MTHARRYIKTAAALEYSGDLPKIISAGRGRMAELIIRAAEAHGIPLYQDPDLAVVLEELGPGQEIPETVFKAAARVLAFCYRVNADFRRKIERRGVT